jgi:hypothetical protein
MDEFIKVMAEKVGIDEATAAKVVEFLKENADQIPALLGKTGLIDNLPAGLGDKLQGLLGGEKD